MSTIFVSPQIKAWLERGLTKRIDEATRVAIQNIIDGATPLDLDMYGLLPSVCGRPVTGEVTIFRKPLEEELAALGSHLVN